MIIMRISGGIGNQLFQYATGRTLASRNNVELKLDVHAFAPIDKNRSYALDAFNISASFASSKDFKTLGIPDPTRHDAFSRVARVFYRMSERPLPLQKRKVILEPSFRFCEDILKIEQSCYLSGVWQSEKYFKNIEIVIKKGFTLKNKPTSETKDWIKKASECNSVSIHIRRGDYVGAQKTNQLHGSCSVEYYNQAVDLICKKVDDPIFFIFSDDIDWVKDNFKIHCPVVHVSDKMIPDYEELIIMSNCKHNIIANSSFSWWGAWLNENKDKIVIAPKKWFNVKNINTDDLIPKSWLAI